jgi:alpha-glucosidase
MSIQDLWYRYRPLLLDVEKYMDCNGNLGDHDSSGDGIGDLAGIPARLDYLVRLGLEGLWLTPFYPSPMADFGYDVADYTGVDPIFGTLADFDALLRDAHARDLRVILDFVPNHASDAHPWSSRTRQSPPSSLAILRP